MTEIPLLICSMSAISSIRESGSALFASVKGRTSIPSGPSSMVASLFLGDEAAEVCECDCDCDRDWDDRECTSKWFAVRFGLGVCSSGSSRRSWIELRRRRLDAGEGIPWLAWSVSDMISARGREAGGEMSGGDADW